MEEMTSSEKMVSNERGEKLFWKEWPCSEKNPSKLVFICHGFGEHCHRYVPMISRLVREGLYVFSHDHVGHGKSEGNRVYIDSFKFFVDDVVQHVTELKERFPGASCFIVGHSMGGAITAMTCLEKPDIFKGAIFIGPAFSLNTDAATPFKKFMARALARIAPSFEVGKMNPDHFTRDKKQVEKILNDPLCWQGGVKARMGTSIMDGMDEIERRRGEFTTAYLLMHGDQDFLCEIKGSEAFHQHTSSSDKTFTRYEGAYHQIHYEPEGQEEAAISEICSWILAR